MHAIVRSGVQILFWLLVKKLVTTRVRLRKVAMAMTVLIIHTVPMVRHCTKE